LFRPQEALKKESFKVNLEKVEGIFDFCKITYYTSSAIIGVLDSNGKQTDVPNLRGY